MPTQQRFLTHREAAALLGVSGHALRRRVARGDLRHFVDPSDLRVRLIDQTELEKFMAPRPLAVAPKEAALTGTA